MIPGWEVGLGGGDWEVTLGGGAGRSPWETGTGRWDWDLGGGGGRMRRTDKRKNEKSYKQQPKIRPSSWAVRLGG